jgi:hypothetical protein
MILTMSSYPYEYVENYSPTTPQVMSPWQTIDQSPIEMFLQEPVPTTIQPEAVYEPHPVIQLEEVPAPGSVQHPPQQHEHSPPMYSGEEVSGRESGETKPVHRDVSSRHSTSPVVLAASTGLIRHTPARPHSQHASHPYKRPQSAAPTLTGRLANGSIVREHRQVRFAEPGVTVGRLSDVILPTVRCASARSISTLNIFAHFPDEVKLPLRQSRSHVTRINNLSKLDSIIDVKSVRLRRSQLK